jgi:hypothetical protein
MKKYFGFILIAVMGYSAQAQTTNHAVYSLFVMNFAKYSSWPEVNGDFKITILGKSKVYDELVKMTAGKNINGHPYKIVQVDNIEELVDTHLIYVSDNKSSNLGEMLKVTEGKPIMIVTEREGLVKKGAGLSFVVIDDKLRFDVNNTALVKHNIKVSSNLTSIANETL